MTYSLILLWWYFINCVHIWTTDISKCLETVVIFHKMGHRLNVIAEDSSSITSDVFVISLTTWEVKPWLGFSVSHIYLTTDLK